MSYTLTVWQDSPSSETPITAENLLLYNAAINDIDTRIDERQAEMAVTAVEAGAYTASVNQMVLVNTTGGSVVITFPTAPDDGSRVGAKQVARASANVVTLQLGGSDTFNTTSGTQTSTLQALNQAAIYQYVAATGVWVNVSDDVPISATTARSIAMSMVLGAFSP